jgi:hypothetical protein
MIDKCSLCEEVKELPYKTPYEPPWYYGGRHCEDCEHWLQTGELTKYGRREGR